MLIGKQQQWQQDELSNTNLFAFLNWLASGWVSVFFFFGDVWRNFVLFIFHDALQPCMDYGPDLRDFATIARRAYQWR